MGAATLSRVRTEMLRGRRWRGWAVVGVALGYAFLSWLPVGYLSYGDTVPHGLGRRLWWPFWNPTATVLLTAGAFLVAWGLHRLGSRRWLTALAVAGSVACLLAAYVFYRGSAGHYAAATDRATALQYGAEELLAGRNPYYRHTQLGNTISPMLGGLLLAVPFVLTHGDLYWQGLVWFVLLIGGLTWWCGARAGVVTAALLFLSPAFRFELAIQSDGWVNGAALVVTGTAVYLLAGRYRASRWWTTAYVVAAILFALAFSYRFIYAVLALPLLVLLWRHYGRRAALTAAIPAGLASAVLIFGPYLADPAVYAPFTKAGLGTSETTVPGLPLITAVACIGVTVIGTLLMRSLAGVWGTMFAVSLVFIALTGWGQHQWYQYLTYAYNGAALVFGLVALALPTNAPEGVRRDRSLLADLRRGR
jgi:hypothetical protein